MGIARWMLAASLAMAAAMMQAGVEDGRIFLGSRPSVTGDGRQFVFEWCDRIWLAPTAGGEARCVSGRDTKCDNPLISSDGRRLVFNSNREGCANHLFELDLATGTARLLSSHSERTQPRAWGVGETNVLCVISRDHSGKHSSRLANLPTGVAGAVPQVFFDMEGFNPSLSPDGTQLLFSRRGSRLFRKRRHSVGPEAGQIWLYTLKTGAFTPLVCETTDSGSPIWAPDGQGFYYLNATGGVRNLYYRALKAGSTSVKLTAFTDDHIFTPSLSADGSTMVFRQKFDFYRLALKKPGAKPELIALRPAAGSPLRGKTRRRFYTSCWNNNKSGCVTFCDKGSQIAFTSGGDLYVMDTVLREPRLVHGSSLTHERTCVFSPDGKVLYYVSDRGDGMDIWKAERADPKKAWWENRSFIRTQITHDDEIRDSFTLSPDGKSFAWMDFCGRLSFAGTNGVLQARGPVSQRQGHYSWAPDGKYVVAEISSVDGQHEIAIVSTKENGKFWQLTKNFEYDGWPTWSPDGQIIAWTCEHSDMGSGYHLCYVYLDNALEERELLYSTLNKALKETGGASVGNGKEKRLVPFEKLIDYVHVTNVAGDYPEFAGDSRTLMLTMDGKTKSVCLPSELSPKVVSGRTGTLDKWIKKDKKDGGKILWKVGNKPAHGDTVFDFNVYQTTDIADYQELAFRTAWGRMKNFYYDPNMHGVDWNAIRTKYLPVARNAGSSSVFARIIQMMLGELDTSHVGWESTKASREEWEPECSMHAWSAPTVHLGLRFDDAYAGKGWKIRDVIQKSPADRREFGFKPGDIVEKIDGVPVDAQHDVSQVLNGPAGRTVTLTVKGRDYRVKSISYEEARNLVCEQQLKAKVDRVHARSQNRFGYLNIDAMDRKSLLRFQREAYAEGYGREGLVIDVRTNHGGNTADEILSTLFNVRNGCAVTRDGNQGYIISWTKKPVWTKPIVVLCSEESGSNAEMFSHTIKHEKRGKLVGRQTGGNVICTYNEDVLDYGEFRNPYLGIFCLDGRDMEYNGAMPDVVVDNQPATIVKGVDEQLEKAIDVLNEEVAAWKKAHPPIKPVYAK